MPQPPRTSARRLATLGVLAVLALAAVPLVDANTASATTTNATPVIGSTYFFTADPTSGSSSTCKATSRVTSFAPTAGGVTTVWVCVEVTDDNGYEDVCDSGAASSNDVRTFAVTTSADVSISDATHPKSAVALTCATGSGTAVAMIGSFEMEYWRPAASGVSAYEIHYTIKDVQAATATDVQGVFDYSALTSLDSATTGAINLGGSLAPGATATQTAAMIYNKGNTAFTIHVSGSALTGSTYSRTLAVGSVKWATTDSVLYADKTALTGTSATTGLSAAVETDDTTTSYPVYFQLQVPAGSSQWTPADTYSGTITFATS